MNRSSYNNSKKQKDDRGLYKSKYVNQAQKLQIHDYSIQQQQQYVRKLIVQREKIEKMRKEMAKQSQQIQLNQYTIQNLQRENQHLKQINRQLLKNIEENQRRSEVKSHDVNRTQDQLQDTPIKANEFSSDLKKKLEQLSFGECVKEKMMQRHSPKQQKQQAKMLVRLKNELMERDLKLNEFQKQWGSIRLKLEAENQILKQQVENLRYELTQTNKKFNQIITQYTTNVLYIKEDILTYKRELDKKDKENGLIREDLEQARLEKSKKIADLNSRIADYVERDKIRECERLQLISDSQQYSRQIYSLKTEIEGLKQGCRSCEKEKQEYEGMFVQLLRQLQYYKKTFRRYFANFNEYEIQISRIEESVKQIKLLQ